MTVADDALRKIFKKIHENKMKEIIYKQDVIDALLPLYHEHEYRIHGKAESYSQYNEAWQDALSMVENVILGLSSAQPERQVELDGTESNIEILSELRAQFNCFDEAEEPCYRALSDAICALSAQPERKTGKWIKLDMHAHIADHKCTACGQECYVPTCMGEPMYAYCPNCGARMDGENDETD